MPRVTLSVRVQPKYAEVVREAADDLRRSEGYIVESALFEMYRRKIGANNPPGKKMEDE